MGFDDQNRKGECIMRDYYEAYCFPSAFYFGLFTFINSRFVINSISLIFVVVHTNCFDIDVSVTLMLQPSGQGDAEFKAIKMRSL